MASRGISGISKSSMSAQCHCIAVARSRVAVWGGSEMRTLERMAVISASIDRPFLLARCWSRWVIWGCKGSRVMLVIVRFGVRC